MITDSISDFLTRIRNGYMAHNEEVSVPSSKVVLNLAKAMEENGYISSVETKDKDLVVKLKYDGKEPVLTGIQRISKPSMRVYSTKKDLPVVMGGMGIAILSTPGGLMTNKEAKKVGVGGEVICYLW